MKEQLKEYYCLNDYIMECPKLKGEAAFLKGKKYLFNNQMIAKSELFDEHDLSDEIDFDRYFILQSEWDLLQQKSGKLPKQQLRIEAEKRNLVYAKNINNDYNLTGLVEIKKGNVLPTVYCYCTEEVAKEILDFHAQQSKEREIITPKEFILSKYPDANFEDKKGFINGNFWKGIESMISEYCALTK